MTTALLSATAEADAGPAAGLAFRDGTVLGRLCGQLASLGVRRVCVLTRPDRASPLPTGATGAEIDAVECPGVADELRRVARVARDARACAEPLLVLPGDLVAHREALAGLLAAPGVGSVALVTTAPGGSHAPVRVAHRRLVAAGSSYHRVSAPNAGFLHVLRVGAPDTAALAEAADGLAPLAEKHSLADVAELLLVGLVRAGVAVGTSDARELQCRRVATPAEISAADAALREVDEDRAVLEAAVKPDDGLFTTYCVSPYSKFLARAAARRGLTPNAVTVTSMGLGAGAAACFALGSRAGLVAGAVLLQVAFTADCVDGQLARYTRRFSAFGGWLDAILDRAKEYAVYAGLAVGAVASGAGGVWALALAALALQTTRHLIDVSYADAHPRAAGNPPVRSLEERGDGLAGGGGSAGRRAAHWARKVVVLPIGERFALVSVTAALSSARVTFVALLAWGSLAAAYTLAGRVLRSLTRPAREAGP